MRLQTSLGPFRAVQPGNISGQFCSDLIPRFFRLLFPLLRLVMPTNARTVLYHLPPSFLGSFASVFPFLLVILSSPGQTVPCHGVVCHRPKLFLHVLCPELPLPSWLRTDWPLNRGAILLCLCYPQLSQRFRCSLQCFPLLRMENVPPLEVFVFLRSFPASTSSPRPGTPILFPSSQQRRQWCFLIDTHRAATFTNSLGLLMFLLLRPDLPPFPSFFFLAPFPFVFSDRQPFLSPIRTRRSSRSPAGSRFGPFPAPYPSSFATPPKTNKTQTQPNPPPPQPQQKKFVAGSPLRRKPT